MTWSNVKCQHFSFFSFSLVVCGFGLVCFLPVLNKRQMLAGTEGRAPEREMGSTREQMTSGLSLSKLRHSFYSSAVLQIGWDCGGIAWILGSRSMQMGSGPSPASLPHSPEKTGSGPWAASKGDAVESTGEVKLLFPLVPGVEVSQFPAFHECG